MNYIDFLVLIPILWFGYKGFSKGFVKELASLVALLLGIYIAAKFSNILSKFLTEKYDVTTEYLPLVSFAIVFIGVIIIVFFIAMLINRLIKATSLTTIDKLAGAVFAAFKVAFVFSVLFVIIDKADSKIGVISKEVKDKSLLYNPLLKVAPTIIPALNDIDINPKLKLELENEKNSSESEETEE